MISIDIPADKSLTISNELLKPRSSKLIIGNCLGTSYISYLYFSLPPFLPGKIEKATLVLFKADRFLNCPKNATAIEVYPLLDYFSSRTTYCHRPKFDLAITQGRIAEGTVSVEIELTEIVNAWIKGLPVNKGIVLCKKKHHFSRSQFGSAWSKDQTLRPFLRIDSKELPFPFINLKCSYEIIPPRKQ